jgi:4-amino-4-deoxy-L-arabinose transferase
VTEPLAASDAAPASTRDSAGTRPRTPPPAKALLLALAALLLCLQGARGLWEPDEGRYSAVAWHMVESGDWFTPHLSAAVPHFTKPPLIYWTLAAGMTLFGRNEWALRLPGALAGVLTVLLTLGLARRLAPADPLLAATIQATALLPFVGVHLVTTDPLLMASETLAVWGFVAAWWNEPLAGSRATASRSRWALAAMWLGFALAFLTKGPPGLLPLLPIVVFAVWSRGARGVLRLFLLGGLAVFVVVAFPWFLLQLRARPDLLHYLLGSEVQGRLAGAQVRNPGWRGLFTTIVPVVVAGLLPWSAVAVLSRWRRRARGAASEIESSAESVASATASAPDADKLARRFLWLWLLLPLLVFCLAQSRQPLYLLPLSVPGSLLAARALAPRWSWSRRQRAWLAAWAVVLLALAFAGAALPQGRDSRRFTAAVLRLAPARPSALLFVDRYPRYGATVYCRCDVESVQLLEDLVERAGPAYRPLAQPLAAELTQQRRDALWLVRPQSVPAWKAALDRAGWRAQRLGDVDEFAVFAATPPA